MRFLHVLAENVAPEVAVEITPGGVDVIGSILGVGESIATLKLIQEYLLI